MRPGPAPLPLWRLAHGAVVLVVLGLVLAPIAWMAATAFKPPGEYVSTSLALLPREPTLAHVRALGEAEVLRRLANSLVVTAGATALSLVVGFMAAYALVRLRFPARLDVVFLGLVLAIKLLPPIVVAIPLFQVLRTLGLLDTLPGLILVYQIYCLPFAIWMLIGFVRDVPLEVEEAAAIDGAGLFRRLTDHVVPLAAPGLVATGVFVAVMAWNEFLFALLFIHSPDKFPLPVYIATLITEDETFWGRLMAIGLLASVPILAVLGTVQRHLLRGFGGGDR